MKRIDSSFLKDIKHLKQVRLSQDQAGEQAIEKWDLYFSVLLENLPDTIYFKDKQSRFILINKAQAAVLGVTKIHEAYGKTDFDFFPEEHARSAFEDEQQIIKSGIPLINKREHIRKADGTYRWVLATKVPIVNEDDVITGIAGVSRDITDQVYIESEIRKSEEKFRSVWENSLDGMRLIDRNGTVIMVNDAYCAMVGKDKSEILGEHFSVLYSDTQQQNLIAKFKDRFSSKLIEPYFERKIELWNGKHVWFEVSNSYIDIDNEEMLLLSIFRDITDRKELFNRMKIFENSIKSVNDGICITDLEANIIMTNRAFCKIFGYEETEILGKNARLFWATSNDSEYLKSLMSQTKKDGWKGETRSRRKDGTEFIAALSTSVIKDDSGNPVAMIGVVNDISVQKRMEEQLQKAQKLDSIGILVGGVSHHFNNILNIIVGYTSLIEETDIDKEKLKQFLRVISEAAERGTDIVHHLTTFLKQSPMRKEVIQFNPIIRKTIDLVKDTFPSNILFDIQLLENDLFINADYNHLRQTLLNLLMNARDALPEGGTITVRTGMIDKDVLSKSFPDVTEDRYNYIEIGDNGIGMTDNVKSHIYEPFFTTKDYGKGVGLGLAMVYGMMESHDAYIDFESEPGKGTTFYLYFPSVNT